MASHQRGQAGTPATLALTRAGVPFTTHTYRHDPGAPSYGLEAAQELGLDPALVFKTLVVDADGTLVVAVVPVNSRLDLKALATAVGAKRAAMADPAAAEKATGYVVGGISPIGQRRTLTAVLDASAAGRDVVYVSGGRRGLDIGVSAADLVAVTGATLATISTIGSKEQSAAY